MAFAASAFAFASAFASTPASPQPFSLPSQRLMPILRCILNLLDSSTKLNKPTPPDTPPSRANKSAPNDLSSSAIDVGLLLTTSLIARAPLSAAVRTSIASRLTAIAAAAPTTASAAPPLQCLTLLLRHTYIDHLPTGRASPPLPPLAITALLSAADPSSLASTFALLSREHDVSLLLPPLIAALHSAASPNADAAASRLLSLPIFRTDDGAATLATLIHLASIAPAYPLAEPDSAQPHADHTEPAPQRRSQSPLSEWLAALLSLQMLRAEVSHPTQLLSLQMPGPGDDPGSLYTLRSPYPGGRTHAIT